MQKSHAGRSTIGWQASVTICHPTADRRPRDLRVRKTLWIMSLTRTQARRRNDAKYFYNKYYADKKIRYNLIIDLRLGVPRFEVSITFFEAIKIIFFQLI